MQINAITGVKWYYDQKITFIFSSDFETMYTKHSRSVILSLKEEDRLFKLQFSVLMVRLYYTRKDTITAFTQEL